jgi:cytoskeletal protein CcmA (bactofilin family)
METRLDPTATFKGQLVTDDDLVVEGALEGSIHSTVLVTVASGGRVTGKIRARDVEVEGAVEGDIWASNHVHLAPTGRIQGDVSAIHLRVDDGGVMQGRILTETALPKRSG